MLVVFPLALHQLNRVSFLELLRHGAGFLAPALVVAVLVATAGRLVLPASGRGPWWLSLGLNALAGAAVLATGLWYFGRDGKMATYAALVLVGATVQWLSGRAWRS